MLLGLALGAASLTGCVATPPGAPTLSPTASATRAAPTPTPTPTLTAAPLDDLPIACDLVTQADAETAYGEPLGKPFRAQVAGVPVTTCSFYPADEGGQEVTVSVSRIIPTLDVFEAQESGGGIRIPGLGESAYGRVGPPVIGDGRRATAAVWSNGIVVGASVTKADVSDRALLDAAIALARTLVGRLPPP